jgi:4,5:9,10-diseco-3-hydroxy-5,9,17-trioxoandrosta-1(10),2-diene-4-oate hydrolase
MTTNECLPVGKFASVFNNTLKLHYHEHGAPSSTKPSLLFLHGSGPGASGYSNFRNNFPAFHRAGYHVLVVDYIGFGLSDMPTDFEYSGVNQVAILHELLQQLGVRQVVPIGNSLGGFYGIQFALTHPHMVPALICMAPGGIEELSKWVPESPGLLAMGAAVAKGGFTAESFRDLLKLIVKDETLLTDDVIAERLPIAQRQPREVYTRAVHAAVWEDLGSLRMPVLGFWGYYDKFIPVRHAMIMQEKIPNCRMVISNQAGHWFMIEEREMFNQTCLEFLQGHSRDSTVRAR